MKILALYLPQYHEVKENSEWWGEGFTDWVTVQRAKPLFDGHEQPVTPLNGYYDLLDKSTMKWQEELITKCNIDGLCFYHYWFKDGRKILEKPAEKLLEWKDININFCFSWANETWARTWSQVESSNPWASIYEKKNSNDNGILLEQKYGGEVEWRKHFEYFLPFFQDERYIKIGNRPVLMLHKLKDVYCFENMLEVWNKLAKANGLGELYIIGNQVRESQAQDVDLVYKCEPGDAMKRGSFTLVNGVKCYDYDSLWKNVLSEENNNKYSIGGFINYDDTPRHGTKGMMIKGATPEKFKRYMSQLISKNKANKIDIMLINAWNEWGEGMHLEPDTKDESAYLDALKSATGACELENYSYLQQEHTEDDYLLLQKKFEREKMIKNLLSRWIGVIRNPGKMITYLSRLGDIAVYGYGILGKHLVDELLINSLPLKYVVDRKMGLQCQVKIISPDCDFQNVDTIIVTAVYDYGMVYRLIREKNKSVRIISFEAIINELY